MKKRLFCAFMSFVLCFSFSLCVYADNPTHVAEESIETVSLETYSLNSLDVPEGAVAVGYNMQTHEEVAYRVNGNIMSTGLQEEYSTESMIPAELAWASAGDVSPYVVIGNDGRTKVNNASIMPYCAVVLLKVTYQDLLGTYCSGGTGCMISSDTVFTAGHVIYSQEHGWPVSVEIIPGIHASFLSNKPFGSSMATELAVCTQYYEYNSGYHDWGVIRLEDNIGNSSGYLGIKFMTRNMANADVKLIGYPGDLNNDTYYQYEQTGTIIEDNTEEATPATYRSFIHQLDTFRGQSGAPILYNNKCIGVHYTPSKNNTFNYAFGITSQLYSFLLAYK